MGDPLAATLHVDLPIRVWLAVQTACIQADDPEIQREVGYAEARIDGLIKQSPAWAIWEAVHLLDDEDQAASERATGDQP